MKAYYWLSGRRGLLQSQGAAQRHAADLRFALAIPAFRCLIGLG